MKISFENIKIKEGYIRADYSDDITNHYIEFELSVPIMVREDLIAYALATLCGTKYDEIHLGLELNENVRESIEKFTRANLHCKTTTSSRLINKKFGNQTLNFSGGFDSLAASAFLPEKSSLVSMDFGGNFSREMSMINQFNTYVVKTNILETDFRKNSWLFMVIGTLLYKDYLNTDYNIFGSIINAAFMQNSNFISNYKTPMLINHAGMINIPYTQSLSEIGTLRVSTLNFPTKINTSLVSLANPKEEKRFRKQLLLEIELDRFNHDIKLTDTVDKPKRPYFTWGQNFLADHLAFYIMKYRGYEIASLTIKDIPEEAFHLSQNLELTFYDRYYTDVLKFIPKEFRANYLSKLDSFNILPFEENDWKEYRQIIGYLSKFYKVI